MALSEQERRMLEEIEQALIADDPGLADRTAKVGNEGVSFNIRSIGVLLLGLCILIAGMVLSQTSLWFVLLGVVGFLVMFAGGMLAFRSGGPSSRRRKSGAGNTTAGRGKDASGGLASRMEDSFRRRFE